METTKSDLITAIYVRVSTEDQSVNAQLQAISTFLASKTTSPTQIYQDQGYSGKNDKRPAFKMLLDDIKAGKVSTLIVYKLDRLSRSLTDLLGLLKTLQAYSTTFISISESIDLSTASG